MTNATRTDKSSAGERVRDTLTGKWYHPKSLAKLRRARGDHSASATGGTGRTGGPEVGNGAGGKNRPASSGAQSIAADLAAAERTRQSKRTTGSPSTGPSINAAPQVVDPTPGASDDPASVGPDFQTVESVPVQPRAPRARRASAAEQEAKAKQADESGALAAMLLLMLDSYAVTTAGSEAALNSIERALIGPSLARLIARLYAERSKQLDKYADPLAIAGGLMLWFVRMRQVLKERGPRDDGPNRPPDAPNSSPPPGSNGNEQQYQSPEIRQALEANKLHEEIQTFFENTSRRP